MRLKQAFKFWRTQVSSSSNEAQPDQFSQPDPTSDPLANVVELPSKSPIDRPAGVFGEEQAPVSKAPQPTGLLDHPQLQAFLASNHFGLGRYQGTRLRTQEARDHGRQSLIAQFRNIIDVMVSQKQAKADALAQMALQTQGVCKTVTSQLDEACKRLARDIQSLRAEAELATQGQGLVLSSLNQYQTGFTEGLQAAIDMELLG